MHVAVVSPYSRSEVLGSFVVQLMVAPTLVMPVAETAEITGGELSTVNVGLVASSVHESFANSLRL